MEMDIKTALDIIIGFIDKHFDEFKEDECKSLGDAQIILYNYIKEKENPHRVEHDADQVVSLFPMMYYPCPYCGKTLANQKPYGLCDNENEFYCDDCNKTYVIDGGAVYEEPNDQWSDHIAIRISENKNLFKENEAYGKIIW